MFPAHHSVFRCHGVPNNYPYHITGVAVNEDGQIIVVDASNKTVQVFDIGGTFLRCLGNDGAGMYAWNSPRKVAVDRETGCVVVIEDSYSAAVVVFNTREGICQTAYPNVTSPKCVTIDSLHRIIVVEDQPEPRIVIFNPWGMGIFGEFNVTGHLHDPVGVAADQAENKIFVCDNTACCVKVFSFDGQFLYQFADEVPNQFGISMTPDGEVVLGDNSHDSNFIFYKQDGTISASYTYGFIADKFSDISFIRNEFVLMTSISGSVFLQPYVYPHLRTKYSITLPVVQVRGSLRAEDLSIHAPAQVEMNPLNSNLHAPATVAMSPVIFYPPAPVEINPLNSNLHALAPMEMDHLNLNAPAPVEMDHLNLYAPAPVEMDHLNLNAPAPVEMDTPNLNLQEFDA